MAVTDQHCRVVVTGPDSGLGRRLGATLLGTHDVISLSDESLKDRARIADTASSADVIIHLVNHPVGDGEASLRAALDRATRGTYDLLTAVSPARFILVSSLLPFRRYSPDLLVDERFAPQPSTAPEELVPYLAELTLREVSRVRPVEAIVLRVGDVVDPKTDGTDDVSGISLHIDDALQGIRRALVYAGNPEQRPSNFHVFHIVDGGAGRRFPAGAACSPAFGYAPQSALTDNLPRDRPSPASRQTSARNGPPPSSRRRVTIYGAGGPLGAAAAQVLQSDCTLRLTDLRPGGELAAGPPQSPGAPLLPVLASPHEHEVVDVTQLDQVIASARNADVLVNCTVLRTDPVGAFDVNVAGALNVMRAAVTHGIRHVVHTGPLLTLLRHPAGYDAEFSLTDDLPPRPGDDLYFVTKFLGQEICRIFAEEHDLVVPALLYCNFVDPSLPGTTSDRFFPFTVSWDDAGQSIARAVQVSRLPRPLEPFHILADLPHGKYSNAKAKALLDWQPQDTLATYWHREFKS